MSKRPAALLLVASAVAGIGVVGVQVSAGSSGNAARLRPWGFGAGASGLVSHIARPRLLRLRAHDFVATPTDTPPNGTSQGDAITIHGVLSRGRGGDSQAGRIDVNEVFTDIQANGGVHLLITITASLSAGQITAVGVGRVSRNGAITIRLPIAGGSGKYRNARGFLTAQTSGGSTTRLAFALLP